MTEAIGAKGERETRLSHRSGYYSRSLIIRGWHAAVAGAAGSDKPMREADIFDRRESQASLSASRSDGEASIGPPRSKRSCHRNTFPPANLV